MKNIVYIYDTAIKEEFFKESLEECRKKLIFLYGEEINLVPAGLNFNNKKAGFLARLASALSKAFELIWS